MILSSLLRIDICVRRMVSVKRNEKNAREEKKNEIGSCFYFEYRLIYVTFFAYSSYLSDHEILEET